MCIDTLLPPRRAPDNAKIKQKMVYASSKDALRRSLVGVGTDIQGTDLSEVAYDSGAWTCPHAQSDRSERC